ncbi:hypothetical protein Verru16b_00545 [Lacunisphaera limnophila]|uniref:Carbohydrate-binding domain-containing protein n=1 Tax=Lacunisphaera limnophila TaxID=1838286 RepID=A0A1D8ARJ6_9BACT|nr:carbohydrate binding family 9 domain-containing protein [Lacunisphaera limnophila]AOS43500.1 hypothetical protein Verru16b_00545 [Lacunisphaera limnophila]
MPISSRLLLCTLLLGARLAAAPFLEVRPADAPPVIDGVITPGEWAMATPTDAFRQVEPVEDGAVTERTEFWVTYDRHHLYVAIRCHDTGGRAGVRAYSMQRDQDNGSDDLVRIVLDTFHRQSDGYYFALTAAGGRHDGLVQNKEEANDQWDALWHGRTSIDDGGWSAEFAIPFKSLSFDAANDTWGFNVARAVRRKQEVMRWSGIVRNKPTVSLPLLGELRGLRGLEQGRGLDLKPFASATTRHDPRPGTKRTEFKPGLDLVWNVTPSLAATLTVNTDFADAEVDERQVNLGRFPLFFPEKRGFFTQDASLFTFAGIRQDPLPFFSRRIGLAGDGTKVDVLGGLKLTGRAGPWTLGLLDVQIDEHAGVDSRNLLAGRVARQVGAESSAGLIFTHGDPRGGDNTLVGTDFNYVNNQLPGGKSVTIRTALQATDSDLAGGQGTAATLSVDYPNEPFGYYASLSRISDRYDPALGFVSRTGTGNLFFSPYYVFRRPAGWIRQTQLFLETERTTTLGADLLDSGTWLGVYSENEHGDYANLWFNESRETYDAPFAIRPGIVIPTGVHRWHQGQFQIGTARNRPVDVFLRWRHGGFLTGQADDYQVNLGWRPSSRLQFSLRQTYRDIRLPSGDFVVRTGSARVSYTFTPDLQLSLLGQFDNISDSLGVNFRIKWTPQPGNDLYLVVNQGYDTTEDHFRPTGNETSLKGAWTYRF